MKSRDKNSQSKADASQFDMVESLFRDDPADLVEKLEAFPKYISRQCMAKFLTKYELFQKMLHVNGSIVECGVLHGAGLMTWAKLSSILEPSNHVRKVVGFDTFEGFPSVADEDTKTGTFHEMREGGLTGSSIDRVKAAIDVYDLNRPIGHIPKVELVQGDITKTAKDYIEENPHLVVSMLYLDLDLYEPTKAALEAFLPRMPKGAILVFDELNAKIFPGETLAVQEVVGLRNIEIKRFPFDSYVSYAVLD